jgi:hypothetical protein
VVLFLQSVPYRRLHAKSVQFFLCLFTVVNYKLPDESLIHAALYVRFTSKIRAKFFLLKKMIT